jgi:hypothetical protein
VTKERALVSEIGPAAGSGVSMEHWRYTAAFSRGPGKNGRINLTLLLGRKPINGAAGRLGPQTRVSWGVPHVELNQTEWPLAGRPDGPLACPGVSL